MSLFSMSFVGGSLILLGSWESLTPTSKTHRFSTITLLSTSFLSLLFIFNSFLSIFDSFSSNDKLGPTLQLQILSISSLFLLFSILGLFNIFSKALIFPYPLINLILLFGFIAEFLLFHLQFKDIDGVENRYYDLMLVPILVCVISTIIELKDCNFKEGCVNFAKLGRGFGLILQGTWKSRGNFTIQCKSHMDLHRGGAIAVLMFNCHLAFLVAVICGVYSVVGKRFAVEGDYRSYRPIGGEMLRVENEGKFTLDSDEDEGGIDEIKTEDGNVGSRRGNGSVELVSNGHGVYH